MLRVVLFGGLMVSWGESPLPTIASTVARSLLAYLLTYRDRPHTRDLVSGTFWPELPDDVARRRLSQALWQIRKALEPHEIVLSEGDTLQINPDLPLWLDVEQFALHQRQATGVQSEAIEQGERCVALYKGEFLAGYYDDWLFPERERLRELFLDVLDHLVVGYKRRGDYGTALAHARHLVAEDPLREQAHREVMRLCHLLGRDAEALQQFEVCCQILTDELGVEPSPKTAALAREITEGEGQAPSLNLPQPLRPSAAFLLDAAQGPELPLVGREGERAELLAHLEVLFQGLGGLVLVEGEAGVGKTRLLRAIAGDAEWRGAEVLWGRGQQTGAGEPYGPLVEALSAGLGPLRAGQLGQIVDEIWLQVLAPLLPPLDAALPHLHPPPALEPAQERDRLVNALVQLLAGWAEIVPLLLVVEDLHWAGHDALDLLTRLVPLLGDGSVLILGSYRSEEARDQPETWQGLQALDRAGVRQRLVLNRLDAAATGRLVRRSLGLGGPAPLFESRLFQETQGNPLFVLETLRALHGEGLLSRDEHGRWSTPWDDVTANYAELPLPRAVDQIIARRLEALAPPLRETIHLAAVLGERFDFNLLSMAGAAEAHDLLGRLRQLVQRRFLDETAADYFFHHDKIRQVAYDNVGMADRPRLHQRAAQALESLQPQRVAALAHHWAVAEVWDKAADYYQRAGDQAREVYANAEAAAHYSRALEALERLPGSPDPVRAYELRLAREAVHHLLGERAAQAEDLAALKALLQDPRLDEPDQRLGVMLRRVVFGQVTGDYAAALAAVREAAKEAKAAGNVQAEYQAHLNWGQMLLWQGKLAAAQEHIEEAYGLAQASQDLSAQAATLNTLGALATELADYEARMNYYRRALAAGQQSGDQAVQARIYNGLANLSHELADYEAAIDHHQQALALRRAIGDRRGEAITFYNLGRVYHDSGDPDSARRMLEQTCRLSHAVGDRRLAGYGYTFLGLVLEEMGELEAAQAAYSTALNLRREVGLHALAVDALAGLARVASARGDHDRATAYADEVLNWLDERGIEGVGDPLLAYKAAYRALFAAGEETRGRAVLQVAYELLMDRAGGITDPERQRAYLHDIEPNCGIWRDYQIVFARSVVTRLPCAEAPTGRPLRDDEYVTVTWTLVAPEDEPLPPGPARRQAQLLRLLREAAEQGAAPGVGDLAAALAVSEPTVRRDLAALRRAGHPVRTRGSRGR